MEKVAFEIEKGETEIIRGRISDFGGQSRADLRIFFKNQQGEWCPTKKGISFPLDLVSDVKKAMVEMEKATAKI